MSSQRSLVPIVQASLVAGTTCAAIWYQLRPLAIFALTSLSGLLVLRAPEYMQPAATAAAAVGTGTLADVMPKLFDTVITPLQALHQRNAAAFCALAVAGLLPCAYLGCVLSGYSVAVVTVVTSLCVAGLLVLFDWNDVSGDQAARDNAEQKRIVPEQLIASRNVGNANQILTPAPVDASAAAAAAVVVAAVDAAAVDDADNNDDENDDLLPECNYANDRLLQRVSDACICGAIDTDEGGSSDDDRMPPDLGPDDLMPDIDDSDLSSSEEEEAGVNKPVETKASLVSAARDDSHRKRVNSQHAEVAVRGSSNSSSIKGTDILSLSSSEDSDDDSISRGLDFQSVSLMNVTSSDAPDAAIASIANAATVSDAGTAAAGLGQAFSHTMTNFLGGLMQRGVQQAVQAHVEQTLGAKLADALLEVRELSASSSDDSDFELLSMDDCPAPPPPASGGGGAAPSSPTTL